MYRVRAGARNSPDGAPLRSDGLWIAYEVDPLFLVAIEITELPEKESRGTSREKAWAEKLADKVQAKFAPICFS